MEYLEDDWGHCEVWEQVEVIKDGRTWEHCHLISGNM